MIIINDGYDNGDGDDFTGKILETSSHATCRSSKPMSSFVGLGEDHSDYCDYDSDYDNPYQHP